MCICICEWRLSLFFSFVAIFGCKNFIIVFLAPIRAQYHNLNIKKNKFFVIRQWWNFFWMPRYNFRHRIDDNQLNFGYFYDFIFKYFPRNTLEHTTALSLFEFPIKEENKHRFSIYRWRDRFSVVLIDFNFYKVTTTVAIRTIYDKNRVSVLKKKRFFFFFLFVCMVVATVLFWVHFKWIEIQPFMFVFNSCTISSPIFVCAWKSKSKAFNTAITASKQDKIKGQTIFFSCRFSI